MKKIAQFTLSLSFVFYILILFILLFWDTRGIRTDTTFLEHAINSSNLIPFNTIYFYIKALYDGSLNIDIPLKNLGGNLILFFPMGIYFPFIIKKTNKVNIFIIYTTSFLLLIEVLQLSTKLGSFDIDDYILNMTGALIGYRVWKSKIIQRIFN